MVVMTSEWDRIDDAESDRPSRTENLAEWISKVHRKKQQCYRSPKRDFRLQAVLTCALHKARYELRSKQLVRMARWQRLKKDFLRGVEYGSCGQYHAAEAERQKELLARSENCDPWSGRICQELDSLDVFFKKLGEIKSLVQR